MNDYNTAHGVSGIAKNVN